MVVRNYLKCSTCKKIIMIRCQVGFLNPVPIRITCNNCKSIIKGSFDNEDGYKIKDGVIIEGFPQEDQRYTLSGEFPIPKTHLQKEEKQFSPFLSAIEAFTPENVMKFTYHLGMFFKIKENDFSHLENLIHLFKNQSWQHLHSEAKQHFKVDLKKTTYNFKNSTEAIFESLLNILNPIINESYIRDYPLKYLSPLMKNPNINKNKISALYKELNKYLNFEKTFAMGLTLVERFIKQIDNFVPIILLSYKEDYRLNFGNEYYITTFDFYDVKDFYIDLFEYLSRISTVYIGLDNIKKYIEYNKFSNKYCNSLEEYYHKSNGDKRKILQSNDGLRDYFLDTIDNKLRNGLGHLNAEYYSPEQTIKYFPYKGKTSIKKEETIFLIDFAFIIYQQFLKVVDSLMFTSVYLKQV